jgi:ribonucleotide reductase beta subunit family protein with ferritin-like domain
MKPHIQEKTEVFTIEYPFADELMKTQLTKCFWTAEEISVEKDVHDVLTNLTEAEKHGVFTTLKLFTLYELKAGAEYWCDRFIKSFPRHELASMGSSFGMMELCVHKPFYNKINELLNATNTEFYTDYVNNQVLKSRMESIDEIIGHEDDLVSLAGFSLVEGVILYSNFAFLKHFQSLGKNKLLNIVRGINFSAR